MIPSSSSAPPGMCLTHGSFAGTTCPQCSTVAVVHGVNRARQFHITTWPEGFVVTANDEEHALVEAIGAIERDGYLLAAVEITEQDEEAG